MRLPLEMCVGKHSERNVTSDSLLLYLSVLERYHHFISQLDHQMAWTCAECEFENEEGTQACEACEAERPSSEPQQTSGEEDPFENFRVGVIVECEDVSGTKLKKIRVDVGDKEPLDVVTNAPNAKEGLRIVVACTGALVDGVKIKRTQINGLPSNGVVCDSVMLGWTGGGAGTAVTVPESFAVGSKPPAQRPRGDKK